MDAKTAMSFASGKLRDCLAGHQSCQKRARLSTIWSSDNMHIIRDLGVGDTMPRRLLKLLDDEYDSTGSANSTAAAVRLVDLDGVKDEFPYVALSYCWGDAAHAKNTLKTTEANIKEFQEDGIPSSLLPKTFRHAREVARGLGLEYLWIDALCIIQGDQEDWRREAPRMAVVYGNATVTLHAVDAANGDGGLFLDENSLINEGILETRAWTMQERAISPRSLLFSRKSVQWECREGHAATGSHGDDERAVIKPDSENASSGFESLKDTFVFFRDWRVPGTEPDEAPREEPVMNLDFGLQAEPADYLPYLQAWWAFIPLYTARSLSYESDRLLAMNGVAAVAQRWAQIRNSWGLWMDFLHWDLLWYVDPLGPPGQRTSRWLAPSWSWAASKGGRVRNRYYERRLAGQNGRLQIKPEIHIPNGTSFDQALPIPAWRDRDSQSIGLKGDLRRGEITASLDGSGNKQYAVSLEPNARWADDEKHDFKPDVADEFPVGKPVSVICMLFHHYHAEDSSTDHVNMLLVLKQKRGNRDLVTRPEDVPESEVFEERTMLRLGLLETSFTSIRDWPAIYEDMWLKVVWLL